MSLSCRCSTSLSALSLRVEQRPDPSRSFKVLKSRLRWVVFAGFWLWTAVLGSRSCLAHLEADLQSSKTARQWVLSHQWEEAEQAFRKEFRMTSELLYREPHFRDQRTRILTWQDFTATLVHQHKRTEAIRLLTDLAKRSTGKTKQWALLRIPVISKLFMSSGTQQIFQDGLNLLLIHRADLAQNKLIKAHALEKDNVEILVRLAQSYLMEGSSFDPSMALLYLKEATLLCSGDPQIQFWLGRAYFLNLEFDLSLSVFAAALPGLKGSRVAPIWFAQTLVKKGDSLEAIKYLDTDYKLYPAHLGSLIMSTQLKMNAQLADKKQLKALLKQLQIAQNTPERPIMIDPTVDYFYLQRRAYQSQWKLNVRELVAKIQQLQ